MQVLMIGYDQTMLTEGSVKPGDTRERHIKYARAMRQRYADGEITVILRVSPSWSCQPVELIHGLTIYPVPCQRWTFAVKAKTVLKNLATKRRFDLTTTQTPFDDGYLGVWLKRHFDIPLNVQMHSSFLDISYWINERPIIYRLFNQLGKWVAHHADTIRVVSQGEKLRLEKLFPTLQGKVIALHPLVNTLAFEDPLKVSEREHVEAVLAQHELRDRAYLLFVGRLAVEKNIPTLLESFARVQQYMPEAALVIAGDGPLHIQLKRIVEQLQLHGSVLWLGTLSLSALRSWYAEARATLLPSFHEGLSRVIVESYLMGTPVIAAPFLSASELICDRQTGFIAPDFADREWFAQRMALLLAHPDKAREMGQEGKRLIQHYLLDEDRYMGQLIEIWQQTSCKRLVRMSSHAGRVS